MCYVPYLFFVLQEEIKITNVTIFVNPYTEPDEEEEKDKAKEKNAEDDDNVCSRIFVISLADYFFSLLQGICLLIMWTFFGLSFRTR